MVEFGEELIMESYRIPWLIWIQLLVTILLFLLLFIGFSVFTSDHTASPSAGCGAAPPPRPDSNTPSNGIVTVEEQITRRDAGTSGEENRSGEGSSENDPTFWIIFRQPNHPCNYIRLAKQALFKCFGFDSSSSNCQHHEKRE